MHILIIGEETSYEECRQKFGESHDYRVFKNRHDAKPVLNKTEIVFDFTIDRGPQEIELYSINPSIIVFANACKISMAELASRTNHKLNFTLIGFCGLPSLVNRTLLEVCLYKKESIAKLEDTCKKLNTPFSIVDDRVGLVTPRVIGMIINEAYYTVQEGTASREDIDLAMKLGTNYPFGPFEWTQRIGVKEVYELLEAVYNDTKDERYKVCSLLKKEYWGS